MIFSVSSSYLHDDRKEMNGNYLKNASEREFQDKFVRELSKFKWQTPEHLNGNLQKVTVQDLINNWRSELNRMNADVLEGVALTDSEFDQVMTKVKQISNSYEAAKILSMEGSTGKIDGIYRDQHPHVTKKQITLTILKKAQVSGEIPAIKWLAKFGRTMATALT